MNKLSENHTGILLYAREGKAGGKIADIFTLSSGLIQVYVKKSVLDRCGSGGMISFSLLRFTVWAEEEIFIMSQYEGQQVLNMMDLSYEEMQCWYYVIELVKAFFPKGEGNEKVYRLLVRAITVAGYRNKKVSALILVIQLLREAGIDAESSEIEKAFLLSEEGKRLMKRFASYDWTSEWEGPIKATAFKAVAKYIDEFILRYGDVQMKTWGAFLL